MIESLCPLTCFFQSLTAQRDATLSQVWLKMARLARASGVSNLARLALERLLETRADHVLALRMLRDVLSEIGDGAACREVPRYVRLFLSYGAATAVWCCERSVCKQ